MASNSFNHPQLTQSNSNTSYTSLPRQQEPRTNQQYARKDTITSGVTRLYTENSRSTTTGTHNQTTGLSQPIREREPFFSAWSLEFVALFISIGSLVSAAVVLSLWDGKRLDDWGPQSFGLSLNTVISALGVTAKASLAFVLSTAIGQHKWNWFRTREEKLRVFDKFDQGSRGPWGSLHLLLWSKGINWAALGAFVTIITLLSDPFLQATVSLQGQDIRITSPTIKSSLPVSHNANLGILLQAQGSVGAIRVGPGPGDTISTDMLYTLPDFGLTSAVYDGLNHANSLFDYLSDEQSPRPTQQVRFTCPTGNCTWPIYTTLAICSKCNQVPQDQIIKRSLQTTMFNPNGTDIYWTSNGLMSPDIVRYTQFDLGYGHIKQFNVPFSLPEDRGGMRERTNSYGDPVLLTAFTNTNYTASLTFRDLNTTLATILVIQASEDFIIRNASWENTTPKATECGIYVCAKAYDTTCKNGNLVEQEIGEWAVRESRSWRSSDLDNHNAGGGPKYETLDRINPTFMLAEKLMDVYKTDLQVVIPDDVFSTELQVQRRFNISQPTINSISMTVQGLFTQLDTSDPTSGGTHFMTVYPNLNPNSGTLVSDILYKAVDVTKTTGGTTTNTNLSSIFDSLANRLSIQLRESHTNAGTPGLEQAQALQQGDVLSYVLHYRVNWGFFLVPVITLFLGCVYFLGVMVRTYRLNLPVWKESVLPVLVWGVEGGLRDLLRTQLTQTTRGKSTGGGGKGTNTKTKTKTNTGKWEDVKVGLKDHDSFVGRGKGYTLQMGNGGSMRANGGTVGRGV